MHRGKVKFIKDHTRFLEFTNGGALPIYLNKILVDGTSNKRCSDFWEILRVVNCKDLIGRRINPNQTVLLELQYHETF